MHYSFVIMAPPPQPRGTSGTLTFYLAIPCYIPHTAGQQAGKTMAVLPHSMSCFMLHCHVCLGISTDISPALWGQCKSKNTAYLPGYSPNCSEGWAWLQMTGA